MFQSKGPKLAFFCFIFALSLLNLCLARQVSDTPARVDNTLAASLLSLAARQKQPVATD